MASGVDEHVGNGAAEAREKGTTADFGGRLTFHGGIDMQHLLPHGTPQQIRAEVRRYCDTLGRDGGYILGPAHLFQPDVSPENLLPVYQAE